MPEGDPERAGRLAAALSLHPLAPRVLIRRGYETPEAAAVFLEDGLQHLPNPFRMKGMDAAVDRLCLALKRQEPITL